MLPYPAPRGPTQPFPPPGAALLFEICAAVVGQLLQVARDLCTAVAELACKAEPAVTPTKLRGAAAEYAGLLRARDLHGAARLAAGHAACAARHVRAVLRWATDAAASAWASASSMAGAASPRSCAPRAARNRAAARTDLPWSFHAQRTRAAQLRQRVAAAARSAYDSLDPERKLARLTTGSRPPPAAACLMLAGGAGLLATAAVLTVHIVWG